VAGIRLLAGSPKVHFGFFDGTRQEIWVVFIRNCESLGLEPCVYMCVLVFGVYPISCKVRANTFILKIKTYAMLSTL
jgi:hypothetical protein